uniref:Uncharacterized protein n=1 Tax=Fagus sylvatica TaxID=28930 RepID=A0A2N9HKI7_FAGSY
MFRKLRWFIGLNHRYWSAKRLLNANLQQQPCLALPKPSPTLDAAHEIAIYIHRFHNLDLFKQGWYRIKITVRWEDNENTYPGTPSRVVQYEGEGGFELGSPHKGEWEMSAPELSSDNFHGGGWRIDDTDNSFSTQPFRIRNARQDVFLSVLISFNLALGLSCRLLWKDALLLFMNSVFLLKLFWEFILIVLFILMLPMLSLLI